MLLRPPEQQVWSSASPRSGAMLRVLVPMQLHVNAEIRQIQFIWALVTCIQGLVSSPMFLNGNCKREEVKSSSAML